MQKRIVIKNGKKYVVNAPGWEDGIGPGAPAGTLWMQSTTDGLWYEVNASGSYAYVNPTALALQTNDLGYQLLSFSGSVYQVYLSGSGANAVVSINSTPWPVSNDYKPQLYLQSTIDGKFYSVYLKNTSSFTSSLIL